MKKGGGERGRGGKIGTWVEIPRECKNEEKKGKKGNERNKEMRGKLTLEQCGVFDPRQHNDVHPSCTSCTCSHPEETHTSSRTHTYIHTHIVIPGNATQARSEEAETAQRFRPNPNRFPIPIKTHTHTHTYGGDEREIVD